MMFVDASAIVAILTKEPEGERLSTVLEGADDAGTSAIAVFEAALALSRKKAQSVERSRDQVGRFLTLTRIEIVPIAAAESRTALVAFERFGKGRGHPAQLNMGDCFAYACARTRDVPLLFIGNDFAQTDIRPAMS